MEVLEPSALELEKPACPHYGACGGCTYQSIPYEEQLKLKSEQVRRLLEAVISDADSYVFEGIKPSPRQFAYRNKMELTFGVNTRTDRWHWECINGAAFMISCQ